MKKDDPTNQRPFSKCQILPGASRDLINPADGSLVWHPFDTYAFGLFHRYSALFGVCTSPHPYSPSSRIEFVRWRDRTSRELCRCQGQTNTSGMGPGVEGTDARMWVVSLVQEYNEGLNAMRSVSKMG